MSTKTTCPLHPDYQGPKPRGERFGSETGRRYRVEQAESVRRKAAQMQRVWAEQLASIWCFHVRADVDDRSAHVTQ